MNIKCPVLIILYLGGSVPNVLHQVSVPVITNDKCQEMFKKSGHRKIIRDSFLCAGYEDGKKDSCEVYIYFQLAFPNRYIIT